MSDYTSKRALVDSIMKNVLITTEEGFELRGEIVDLIKNQPTLDEKEIIRKSFERVVAKLESELKWTRAEQSIECERTNGYGSPLQSKNSGKIESLKKAIEIVKEECGINE